MKSAITPARCLAIPATALLVAALPLTTAADSIQLNTGETLEGEITSQSDDAVNFQHPVLGPLVIPKGQIESLIDADAEPAEAPQPEATPTPEPVFGPSVWFLPGFDKTLEAGFDGSDGNTENLDLYLSFTAKRETETDRWDLLARYFRATDDGDTSENDFTAQATKDWLIPDADYFYFARATYEFDQFESWEHRTSAFAGVGYTFQETAKFELRGRAGGGAIYEFGNVNELTWEALLGIEGVYRISERQELTFSNNLLPSITNGGEFRNLTEVAWQIALDTAKGLSLKLGIENEYDSDPAAGDEENDLKYFGALVLSF